MPKAKEGISSLSEGSQAKLGVIHQKIEKIQVELKKKNEELQKQHKIYDSNMVEYKDFEKYSKPMHEKLMRTKNDNLKEVEKKVTKLNKSIEELTKQLKECQKEITEILPH